MNAAELAALAEAVREIVREDKAPLVLKIAALEERLAGLTSFAEAICGRAIADFERRAAIAPASLQRLAAVETILGQLGPQAADLEAQAGALDRKLVTIEARLAAIAELPEAICGRAIVELERRALDAVAKLPAPKNGTDGRDAFELEAFAAELLPDLRTLRLTFKAGEMSIARDVLLPHIVYRGPYEFGGKTYERGDAVTFAGEIYIAERQTSAKPTGEDWQLAAKRGRDAPKSPALEPPGPRAAVRV